VKAPVLFSWLEVGMGSVVVEAEGGSPPPTSKRVCGGIRLDSSFCPAFLSTPAGTNASPLLRKVLPK
jgi:hypothetical protein